MWFAAMEKELQVMDEQSVWHLEELPENVIPVGCWWVYMIKRDEFGQTARYKAWLVAQGFKRVKRESYDDTFSPVVNFGAIQFFLRLSFVLQVVTHPVWHNQHLSVCPNTMRKSVYMSQPQRFAVPGLATSLLQTRSCTVWSSSKW